MRTEHNQQSGGISRRQFLGALGIGAVALGTSSVLPGHARQRFVLSDDRFGRLFPQLPAFFDQATESLRGAMREMGQEGGLLDAKDALDQGPLLLITNPALSVDNPNHPTHTAGTTFMGQFMDHDMTFDLTSRLGVPTQPEASVNTRTPALDLDSVYGGGPDDDPDLYTFERGHAPKFKIGFGGLFEDLPRTANRTAIIADPRNDENLMLAGLHAAFLLFHNKVVDYVEERDHRAAPDEVFSAARRLTRWHYQWMILHEFLPLFIGQSCVDDILSRGRQFYRPREAFMPVEFQGAVYRFGHTLVRPSYRANLAGDNGAPFFGMIFDPAGQGQADPIDLRGGVCARRRFIGWQTFFDFGPTFTDGPDNPHPAIRTNKMVDTHISTPLFRLPLAAIASGDPPISLPQRNLLRHITWSLPSGQRIARAMGLPSSQVLASQDLAELRDFGHSLDVSTPLWYYALKEGEVVEGGLRLGPVGGRIVGEVIIGLLQLDQHSYLAAEPRWRPTLPTRSGRVTGDFKMVDFLTFAGVAPDQRGQ